MKLWKSPQMVFGSVVLLLCAWGMQSVHALGTAFTYQGQLQQSGIPAAGTCDFQFDVFAAASGGSTLGTQIKSGVTVTDGLFTVPDLDFGGTVFTGEDRYLAIQVRCPAGSGTYVTLVPRQKLTATPYALYAPSAGSASGLTCTGCVSSTALANGAVTSSKIATGTIQTGNLAFTPGTVTSITAGTGLSGGTITTSGTIGVNFGTDPGTVATGGHNHLDQSWSGAAGNGLSVETTTANGTGIVGKANTGSLASGVYGESTSGFGVYGRSTDSTGVSGYTPNGFYGVSGESARAIGSGVHGVANTGSLASGVFGESTSGFGVYGKSTDGTGVRGFTVDGVDAVFGESARNNGVGVHGKANTGSSALGVSGESADGTGVYGYTANGFNAVLGESARSNGNGVHGRADGGPSAWGVFGESTSGVGVRGASADGTGVYGYTANGFDAVFGECTRSNGNGVHGRADGGPSAWGVFGDSTSGVGVRGSSSTGTGVAGASTTGLAGQFSGNVQVTGTLTKGGGSFKIDHPLDPTNKYLSHSFVESPDMLNIYNGNVALDDRGEAWVELPAWFEALNKDFRYQLTAVGGPGPNLHVAEEIHDHGFKIAGGQPGLKVSWQVTGIRHDPYAEAHRIQVEEDKPPAERGTYLHPKEHGMPDTAGTISRMESKNGGAS